MELKKYNKLVKKSIMQCFIRRLNNVGFRDRFFPSLSLLLIHRLICWFKFFVTSSDLYLLGKVFILNINIIYQCFFLITDMQFSLLIQS